MEISLAIFIGIYKMSFFKRQNESLIERVDHPGVRNNESHHFCSTDHFGDAFCTLVQSK